MRQIHIIIAMFLLFSGVPATYAQTANKKRSKPQKMVPLPPDTTNTTTKYGTMTVRKRQRETIQVVPNRNKFYSFDTDTNSVPTENKKGKRKFPWIFQKRNVTTNNNAQE